MSISSTVNRAVYAGNGVTTAFSFPYEFFATTDLVVLETVIATGVVTTKALTTHYTVSGTPDASGIYPNGGTVTALVAPDSAVKWSIYRDPAATQTTVFVDNAALPAASLNNGLDKLTIVCQRLKELVLRAVRLADGDVSGANVTLPTPVASKLLGWDALGTSIVNYATSTIASGQVITSFAATMLASASATAWRTLLGFKPPTQTLLAAGSGTYNTPAGVTHLFIRMVGAGGGGAGSGTGPAVGSAGGDTTFATLTAGGGGGGGVSLGGAGGLASGGDLNLAGGQGGTASAATSHDGGDGGVSPFGGAGKGGALNGGTVAGVAATSNTGSGGGGAAANGTANSGGGGGAGAYIEKTITAPAVSYAYAVGGAGGGGTNGTSGYSGASGATGLILIMEEYS